MFKIDEAISGRAWRLTKKDARLRDTINPNSLMNTPFDLASAWHSLLWYFGLSLTMMAIGNGFAFLNRRWKWIVGIKHG